MIPIKKRIINSDAYLAAKKETIAKLRSLEMLSDTFTSEQMIAAKEASFYPVGASSR